MKKITRIIPVLLAAAALVAAMTVCPLAAEKNTAGQLIFNSEMPVEAWSRHAKTRPEYDKTEDAFKITPVDGSVAMCNGHNAGTIEYLGDPDSLLKDYPSFKVGKDGFKWVKIRIKSAGKIDMSQQAFKAMRFTVGDNTKSLGEWNAVDAPVCALKGIEDGKWHEYVIDLTKKHSADDVAWNGDDSWFASNTVDLSKLMVVLGTKLESPIYIQYICFFNTEAEAKAFSYPKSAGGNTPTPPTGSALAVAAAFAAVAVTAGVTVYSRRRRTVR